MESLPERLNDDASAWPPGTVTLERRYLLALEEVR